MTASVFTLVFLAALAANVVIKVWLNRRQARFVAAHRARVPEAFDGRVSLGEHQRAADYTVARSGLGLAHIALDAALLLAFTLGGGLQALDDFWRARLGGLWADAALVGSVFALAALAELPLSLVRTFGVEARFGFNRTTPVLFAADLAKQTAVAVALGGPLLLAVLWLTRVAGEYWWVYAWGLWMAFNFLVLALYPTLIAPLFNRFTPLQDPALRTRVERLLGRCGFRAQGLYVMDGSKRSAHGNAYFTGVGRAKRIVFFDTLLKRLSGDEIEAVLAHELGHFKRRHVLKRVLWMAAASLGFLALLGWLAHEPWFYAGLGVTPPAGAVGSGAGSGLAGGTGLALVLFFLVMPVFTFLFQPLSSFYSRKHEFEADRFAAEQADAGHLIQALVKLYRDNAATLTPDPLHSAFYDSHPPANTRIAHLRALVGQSPAGQPLAGQH